MNTNKNSAEEYSVLPFFETSPNLLCIAGFDGYFRRINPATCKTLGYSTQELMERTISEFIHPDDHERTRLNRDSILQGQPLLNFENRYITKSGQTVWLSWNSISVEDESLVYAIAENITHIKAREAERNHLLEQQIQTIHNLKKLNFQTAHDIRSPVAALLTCVSLIDSAYISDPKTLELFEMLEKSAEDMQETLNTYLGTLEHKHTTLMDLISLKIQEVFDVAMLTIESLLKSSEVSIKLELAADCQDLIFNRSYLQSIFLNLVTNSIKYAHPQRKPLIKIRSACNQDGNKIIEYSDNGIGFDSDKHREQLFGFNQTFHENEDSQGIGLYLIHQHMKSLGGRISVESKINEGTHFTLEFKVR